MASLLLHKKEVSNENKNNYEPNLLTYKQKNAKLIITNKTKISYERNILKGDTMNNTEHFGKLTERMQAFREEVLDAKPYIDAQRAVLATEAYKENQNQPRVMVRALMLQKILEGMSIYIDDKSLIAGNQATKNKNAPIFPEYTMEFVMNELDLFEKRDGDVFYITEETKEQLREIAPFWENNNLRARGEALLPEEVDVFMETGVFGMEGKLNAGDAHLAVNYQRILSDGLKGYEKE